MNSLRAKIRGRIFSLYSEMLPVTLMISVCCCTGGWIVPVYSVGKYKHRIEEQVPLPGEYLLVY